MKLQGSFVALVTPMLNDKSIDYASLQTLIEWHIAAKTDGFVISGSTGEGATLIEHEKLHLFKSVLDQVNGHVPVIVGTGSNATAASVAFTQAAFDLGAEYSLLTTPYYNKPSQRGLYEHFKAIALGTPAMQHILYNVPSRTACTLDVNTAAELSHYSNIIGLKDSGSSLERLAQLRQACAAPFSLLSGDDDITCAWTLAGGDGAISVTANIAPSLMHNMVHAALSGDSAQASTLDQKLAHLHRELFCQSNPIPVKWLLAELGHIQPELRLPLTWLEPEFEQRLREAYQYAL